MDDKVEPGEKSFDSGIDEDRIKVDVKTSLYDGVHRNMKQRHIQMIALAGVCDFAALVTLFANFYSARRWERTSFSVLGKQLLLRGQPEHCKSSPLIGLLISAENCTG